MMNNPEPPQPAPPVKLPPPPMPLPQTVPVKELELSMEEKLSILRTTRSEALAKPRIEGDPKRSPIAAAATMPKATVQTFVTRSTSNSPEDSPEAEKVGNAPFISHPWKTSKTTTPDEYEVLGGIAAGITIADQVMSVTDTHYIYAIIERNPTSRAIVAVTLSSAAALPADDYTYQHVKIAQIVDGKPVQHRFEDIRVTEILIQDAGELKFVTVFDTTNTYDLP